MVREERAVVEKEAKRRVEKRLKSGLFLKVRREMQKLRRGELDDLVVEVEPRSPACRRSLGSHGSEEMRATSLGKRAVVGISVAKRSASYGEEIEQLMIWRGGFGSA